jgi:hypothetical protein
VDTALVGRLQFNYFRGPGAVQFVVEDAVPGSVIA